MESDESLNQSAFLHSFSAYSDKDSDIETINNVFEEQKDSNSPMTKSMSKLMDYKVKKKSIFE